MSKQSSLAKTLPFPYHPTLYLFSLYIKSIFAAYIIMGVWPSIEALIHWPMGNTLKGSGALSFSEASKSSLARGGTSCLPPLSRGIFDEAWALGESVHSVCCCDLVVLLCPVDTVFLYSSSTSGPWALEVEGAVDVPSRAKCFCFLSSYGSLC